MPHSEKRWRKPIASFNPSATWKAHREWKIIWPGSLHRNDDPLGPVSTPFSSPTISPWATAIARTTTDHPCLVAQQKKHRSDYTAAL